ncbi:MAG: hypothetical protein WD802_04430 [Gemmatimonadaceae bacterium]
MKAANETVKYLRGVDAKLNQAELKLKIAELADVLSDARDKINDAKDENESLHARIKELETARDVRSKLVLRNNVYFLREESGETGPYCPRCFEVDKILIPLPRLAAAFNAIGNYKCSNCGAVYV